MDTKIPKGPTQEVNGDGRPAAEPGVYRLKGTDREFITAPGKEGSVQAEALNIRRWEGAWEKVGEVPSHSELLKQRRKDQEKIEAEAKKAKAKKLAEEL